MSRTITIEKTLFSFDELSDKAKENARVWWRDCENQDMDLIGDDMGDKQTIANILGIVFKTRPVQLISGKQRYDPCIYYSGFSSQGDGACFEGSYAYEKQAPKRIRAHAPNDEQLACIADQLQQIQRKAFYHLTATTSHRGHYYHSGYMDVDVCNSHTGDDATRDQANAIKDCLRDFANWIYRQLEAEYNYRMSDENVDDNIRGNEYKFDENGKIA